jgi:O-Antigen ligase
MLLVLLIGGVGAAVVCVWALAHPAIVNDADSVFMSHVSVTARSNAGHDLGIVLLIALVVVMAVASGAIWLTDRRPLSARHRQLADLATLGVVALIPVVVIVGLAASSRGLTGEVSHIWSSLTSTGGGALDNAARLATLSNSRPDYWHEGWSVATHHLLAGAGPGSFGVAHLAYPTATLTPTQDVSHAHSYVIETFADLGLLGVVVSLALLLSWGRAATLSAGVRLARLTDAPADTDAERAGLWALIGVVVAFGVSSALDWTWFYPGVTVVAMACAGWLAGRGPLRQPVGLLPAAARRPLITRPAAIGVVTALVVVALAGGWEMWQPLHSTDANNAALTALEHRQGTQAAADARSAANAEPVAIAPLHTLATIYSAFREPVQAQRELVKATTVQPQNPQPWCWLGVYQLSQGDFGAAAGSLQRSVMLDVTDSYGQQALLTAAKAHQSAAATAGCGSGS